MDDLDTLRHAWADQAVEVHALDPDELVRRSQDLERRLRRRNLREHLAGIVVAIAFGWVAWASDALLSRLGAALVVVGDLVVMRTLARSATPTPAPGALAQQCLDWQRRELEREHALLSGIWRWYLGPLVPGLALFLLGELLDAQDPGERGAVVAVAACCGLVFIAIGALNRSAAHRLAEALEALEALEPPETAPTDGDPDG